MGLSDSLVKLYPELLSKLRMQVDLSDKQKSYCNQQAKKKKKKMAWKNKVAGIFIASH